jgi:hypothetical protein
MNRERSNTVPMPREGAITNRLLQLPAIAGVLKRDMPQAHACMMLALQSVAISFISNPHLLPDSLPAFAASEHVLPCAAVESLASSLKFAREIYELANVLIDVNWFELQSKREVSRGIPAERMADALLLRLLCDIKSCFNGAKMQQLYCVLFQTLNSMQGSLCPLLHPTCRFLELCRMCAAEVSSFIEVMQSASQLSAMQTIAAMKKVVRAVQAVLSACSPSQFIYSSPKVLRVTPADRGSSQGISIDEQATFPSISAAIAAASPGCIVLICPGVYSESLQIRVKGLVLVSDCAHAGCSRCCCTRCVLGWRRHIKVTHDSCMQQDHFCIFACHPSAGFGLPFAEYPRLVAKFLLHCRFDLFRRRVRHRQPLHHVLCSCSSCGILVVCRLRVRKLLPKLHRSNLRSSSCSR